MPTTLNHPSKQANTTFTPLTSSQPVHCIQKAGLYLTIFSRNLQLCATFTQFGHTKYHLGAENHTKYTQLNPRVQKLSQYLPQVPFRNSREHQAHTMDPRKPLMYHLLIVCLERVMVYIPTLPYCNNS